MIGILSWGGPSTATGRLRGVVWNSKAFRFPVLIRKAKGTDFETVVRTPSIKTLTLLSEAAKH
jgi:hypothetical protein